MATVALPAASSPNEPVMWLRKLNSIGISDLSFWRGSVLIPHHQMREPIVPSQYVNRLDIVVLTKYLRLCLHGASGAAGNLSMRTAPTFLQAETLRSKRPHRSGLQKGFIQGRKT